MSKFPVQTRLIGDIRRGMVKLEEASFVVTAINEYYKILAQSGAIKDAKEKIVVEEPKEVELTPAQKAAKTRAENKAKAQKAKEESEEEKETKEETDTQEPEVIEEK